MRAGSEFFNLYNHDFIRISVGVPEVRVADPEFNAGKTLELIRKSDQEKAILALFPELGLTAYSCEDLFHQRSLLDSALSALAELVDASRQVNVTGVVGIPLAVDHMLFNCAVVFHNGKILGVVPKSFLPNYREFYEMRQFAPASAAHSDRIAVCGQSSIPFGSRLLFRCHPLPQFIFFVELCEDLWVPIPPSSSAALAGATVLLNLSASNITIGKHEYRHSLVANQSARCLAAYAYTGAGTGESTTDLAWDGHAMVYENGHLIAESERFCYQSQLVLADIDLEHLVQERMRQNSFAQSLQHHASEVLKFSNVFFDLDVPSTGNLPLQREYDRFPYVPPDPSVRDRRCYEAYNIQVQGLVVQHYVDRYSHHRATRSLREWLIAEGVPALTGRRPADA